MTARLRLLGAAPGFEDYPSTAPDEVHIDNSVIVIILSILCAFICMLGLFAISQCSWIRLITGRGGDSYSPRASKIRGLKKKVVESLPKLTYSGDDVEAEKLHDCAICLADFVAGDEIRVLPQCQHGFHVACVDTWLASRASCPSCRSILEVAWCEECDSSPPATAPCSAAGLQPEARESYIRDSIN